MKELFIIISSKDRRPVPSKFKEKLMEHFRGSKIKPSYQMLGTKQNVQPEMAECGSKMPYKTENHS